MTVSAADPDRGIRAIFASALNDETPAPSWIDHLRDGRLMHHVALGGSLGAAGALLAFVVVLTFVPPQPVSADPLTVEAEAAPTSVATAKADRMGLPAKLAMMASAADAIGGSGLGGRSLGFAGTPIAAPGASLAYVDESRRTGAAAAIETNISDGRIEVASLGGSSLVVPGAAAAAAHDDEEDDEAIVPIPRARPERPPLADALPLPRPRPYHVATLTTDAPSAADNAASGPEPVEVEIEPAPPPPRASGPALGFFSSPTEPVKAPPRISVDTPFGVPYVLQTGSVETACLKPELVDILRRIEAKYGQKVVITSGFRDRGRQGSLHRQCAAVDIQVGNVSAEALAAFARTIPGIGGVGTYCHSSMIHVDIGAPRDWKYGCGSFFAMRGSTGSWGKVPTTLAKATTTGALPAGDAGIDTSQIAD